MPEFIDIDIYLHGSKESSYDAGVDAGLTGEALDYFKYAGDEHKITYRTNTSSGEAIAIAVDDKPIITLNQSIASIPHLVESILKYSCNHLINNVDLAASQDQYKLFNKLMDFRKGLQECR